MMSRVALVTGLLLLVPLVAMQLTDEVRWNLADFVVAGALLFGAGATYHLLAARTDNLAYRAAVGVAVGVTLMLVWANLAVGLIGSILLVVVVVALEALFGHVAQAEAQRKVVNVGNNELRGYRAEQLGKLNGYRVVDPAQGVVAIPIDRAMELTVSDARRQAP